MKRPRYELGTVFVELTRRCNMKCAHCMRGPAQRKDMPDDVMDALISKLEGVCVGSYVLGGGESSLVPERIRAFFDRVPSWPGYVGITTNGKRVGRGFLDAVDEVSSRVETYVTVSDDDQHEECAFNMYDLRQKVTDAGASLSPRYGNTNGRLEYHDSGTVLRMGRGVEFNGMKAPVIESYCVIDESENDENGMAAMSEDEFYVDVDGNVWPHCDLSYRFMRLRKNWCLGNVKDPGFDWYEAAVKFNLDHADELPTTVVEPGEELVGVWNSPHDYQFEAAERNVAFSKKIAEGLEIA